jgi:hypothetical protein
MGGKREITTCYAPNAPRVAVEEKTYHKTNKLKSRNKGHVE